MYYLKNILFFEAWLKLHVKPVKIIKLFAHLKKIYIFFVLTETVGFVDKLFECLTSKNYLGNTAAKEAPKEEVKAPVVKTDVDEVRVVG